MSRAFVDSNVLLYGIDRNDDRRIVAQSILTQGPTISVQCLNEFASVARRKLKIEWALVHVALDEFCLLCPAVVPMTLKVHQAGMTIAERYRLSIYDALIVAAALVADCDVLYSEDMHPGLIVDGRLRIENPFA